MHQSTLYIYWINGNFGYLLIVELYRVLLYDY